jgi:hypothetical protein
MFWNKPILALLFAALVLSGRYTNLQKESSMSLFPVPD